ncbi:MAG: transglycosylase SLT domain-containing protein [Gammaproteobacteria bacterium]|nr:transglycosylase SLT domain-containing protein [Gammaproteobacteria bacterium]
MPASAPATAPAGTAPGSLYAEADAALARARAALAAIERGEAETARVGLASARRRLRRALEACAALPGCGLERLLAAQDALLAQQAAALTAAAPASPAADVEGDGDAGSPLLGTLPASAESVRLLRGRDLGELIEMNEPLRAALREWLTWLRPFLLDAWENYAYLRHRMWPAYAEAGLPEALLFGILAKESGGKVHAVSSAGAAGPLQFMPATGQRLGLGLREGFDTRYDPAAAARANAAYLDEQFARFNDDLALALAAYNGGEGRLGRLSAMGQRRFWDSRVQHALPRETRTYVPMVLAAAWLFLHPERYGLEFPVVDAAPASITLADALSLNELAICLGQAGNPRGWFRTLRNLNPRWEPNDRLPAGSVVEAPRAAALAYAARCTGTTVVGDLHALQDARLPGGEPAARAAQARTHVVARGETLSLIARRHGCSGVQDIARANRIAAPRYAIREGQRLVLPDCRT